MILSQPDLRKAVEKGEIRFDPPLAENQWGEASVDLRLGFSFTKLKQPKGITISLADGPPDLGDLGLWETKTLDEKPVSGQRNQWVLGPKEFVLAQTYEKITVPRWLIARVEGRSSYARVGLSMHQTAPWIQPGWDRTAIILEIMNHGSFNIALTPLLDRPCQLTFFQLSQEVPAEVAYGSKPTDLYQHQTHPFKPPRTKPKRSSRR
ncbi:MAG: dCTP deaminase [Candidatus Lambdaproteobacteria bacterium]|nr:dCTP deaminase [Candidatus Lambdaproteobacteria bacterium]